LSGKLKGASILTTQAEAESTDTIAGVSEPASSACATIFGLRRQLLVSSREWIYWYWDKSGYTGTGILER